MFTIQTLGLLLQLVVLVQGATPTPPTEEAPSGITSTSSITTSFSGSSFSGNSSTTTTPSSTITAQWPSLSNVSDCIFTCNNLAIAQSNCTSIVDVSCYCQNQIYQTFVIECVSSRCPAQLTQTIELAKSFCAVSSISISFAVTSFSTSVPSLALTATPTTTLPTLTTTSGSTASTGLSRPGIYIGFSALVVAAILPKLIFLG